MKEFVFRSIGLFFPNGTKESKVYTKTVWKLHFRISVLVYAKKCKNIAEGSS